MTEGNLSCYTRRDGRISILAFEGTLDLATSGYAIDAIQHHQAEHGPDLVLDTSRLDFIDSKGVGILISAAKSAREAGGAIYLPNPATPVRKILETCGLSALFPNELPRVPALTAVDSAPASGRPAAAPAGTARPAVKPASRPAARPARKAA